MADVLIIGSGGREDALRQAMLASPEVARAEVHSSVEQGVEAFRGSSDVFSIVGPEAALVDGASDYLRELGHTVLGVSQEAAQYEASKAKAIRTVPELFPQTFIADGSDMPDKARAFVEMNEPGSYYIKANGLAAGKGSIGPHSRDHAIQVIEDMISGGYDGAGTEIINFQELITGPEVSPVALVGRNGDFVILPYAQDHKKLLAGDQGPNTGGTGAYTPVPESLVNANEHAEIEEMIATALEKAAAQGTPIEQGVLYAGVIKDLGSDGKPRTSRVFKFMEWNIRFGDPETQSQLASMVASGVDVYRLLRSAADGDLEKPNIDLQKLPVAALTVALMANGYPVKAQTGEVIYGIDQEYQGVTLQKAGMKFEDGKWITSSGRVVYATGVGEDIDEAADRTFAAIGKNGVHFKDMHYRHDIGWQARTRF
ncbi:hypothetical protein KDA00_00655 [Candidatus Saccharibacteria bacterium]|nr:hypothetical protein [Candidatus Saccharibacteria bacterium]